VSGTLCACLGCEAMRMHRAEMDALEKLHAWMIHSVAEQCPTCGHVSTPIGFREWEAEFRA
jgi:hypothetical protein